MSETPAEDGTPRRAAPISEADRLAGHIRALRRDVAALQRAVNPKPDLSVGTTAERPAEPYQGQPYYDTTLSKPVYAAQIGPPVVWKDAAGTTV